MSVEHLIPRGQTVNREGGRLVRFAVPIEQAELLRRIARLLGMRPSEVAAHFIRDGVLKHRGLLRRSVPQLAKCKECRGTFYVGTGTGRRRTALYCSSRCKQAFHKKRREFTRDRAPRALPGP